MAKKILKLRLREDGTWENVYSDGSTDQEFHELNGSSLANMYTQMRNRKMQEYMLLQDLKEALIEEVIDHRGMPEAIEVLDRIKNL